MPAMPFKANAKCRRHIPKQKRRLTNWPAYEASLRQRDDLTVWFSELALLGQRSLWFRDADMVVEGANEPAG
jgi:hypothetical protein